MFSLLIPLSRYGWIKLWYCISNNKSSGSSKCYPLHWWGSITWQELVGLTSLLSFTVQYFCCDMTFRLLIRGQQITTCQLSRAHCFNKYAFIEAQLQLFIYSTIYGCSCPRGNNCNKGGVILQLKMFTIKVLSKNFTVTKNLLTPAAETQTVVQPLLLRTGRHSMTEKLGWPRSA